MTGLHEAEDLYHILGVTPNVAPEKIKEQFRFLAQAFHPDKHASPAHKARAGEMLRKITEAYRILSDPLQRAAYDKKRSMHNTAAFEELGVFQRERASTVDGHDQPGNGVQTRRTASAQIVVKRFQQGYVCSECGGQVREHARFCLHCGKTFAAAESVADESPPTQINHAQKNYSKLRGVWTCSNCRGNVQPQSSFCIHCGQSFGKSQP
jgi:DnaJ-class molecular chaperone